MSRIGKIGIAVAAGWMLASAGEALSPEVKSKVDAKLKQLQSWSSDPAIVGAVKSFNVTPPAEIKGMTQEKWRSLSVLDPLVRSLTRNPLAVYLKTRKDAQITECFVSGLSGEKVAFLSKTTNWSHKGKDKHMLPLAGKTYIGPVELDESTGSQQVQVGLPVLDGGKPIGSIVIGLAVSKL